MGRLTCDRCGPAVVALVSLTLPGAELELHFCGHHFAVHELALVEQGWALRVDRRSELVSRGGVYV